MGEKMAMQSELTKMHLYMKEDNSQRVAQNKNMAYSRTKQEAVETKQDKQQNREIWLHQRPMKNSALTKLNRSLCFRNKKPRQSAKWISLRDRTVLVLLWRKSSIEKHLSKTCMSPRSKEWKERSLS